MSLHVSNGAHTKFQTKTYSYALHVFTAIILWLTYRLKYSIYAQVHANVNSFIWQCMYVHVCAYVYAICLIFGSVYASVCFLCVFVHVFGCYFIMFTSFQMLCFYIYLKSSLSIKHFLSKHIVCVSLKPNACLNALPTSRGIWKVVLKNVWKVACNTPPPCSWRTGGRNEPRWNYAPGSLLQQLRCPLFIFYCCILFFSVLLVLLSKRAL